MNQQKPSSSRDPEPEKLKQNDINNTGNTSDEINIERIVQASIKKFLNPPEDLSRQVAQTLQQDFFTIKITGTKNMDQIIEMAIQELTRMEKEELMRISRMNNHLPAHHHKETLERFQKKESRAEQYDKLKKI